MCIGSTNINVVAKWPKVPTTSCLGTLRVVAAICVVVGAVAVRGFAVCLRKQWQTHIF